MNIDITNYKGTANIGKLGAPKEVQYRLTSHGGRKHDLYNRTSGRVFPVSAGDYASIKNSTNGFEMCRIVERAFFK
jgi:hypothetical protein